MLRSRRFAFVAAALLVGLSACGDDTKSTSPANSATGSPVVIEFGNSPSGGANETAATADRMMMPMGQIIYVFDGTAPDLGASSGAWTFPLGAAPDEARVRRIAEVLGVTGELVQLPADQGGGWMIGASDYTTASLTVSPDGMLSWWFSPTPVAYDDGCMVAMPAEGTEGGDSSGGSAGSAGGDVAVMPPEEICDPQPPANVPSAEEALEAAKALYAELGYDVGTLDFETYADEWGANVSVYLLLNGARSPLGMSIGFGAEGAVTWASGMLATPVAASDYPLVSVEQAVERLNDETGRYLYFGGVGPMARAETATQGAPVEAVAPEPGDQVGDTVAIDQPVCDPAADCVIEPVDPADLEPITVTLTDVRLDLTMVWDADGVVWLLPAYTFSDADGGMYTVIAIDDSFISLPEELPMPEPMPIETLPPETLPVGAPIEPAPIDNMEMVDQAAATEALVGLKLDEATKAAEGLGWEVRVSTLDGEPQVLTMDLRSNRVNVAVVDGVVTAVDSVG